LHIDKNFNPPQNPQFWWLYQHFAGEGVGASPYDSKSGIEQ